MDLVRPIATADLPALVSLAGEASYGLTTLPPDETVLTKRIRRSVRSFADRPDGPGGETYLFVLEVDGTVAGISGILSRVGGFQPFWAYQRQTLVHESRQLDVRRELEVLQLVAEHQGPTEIGSLFLSPRHRQGGRGRLLSLSRFLFMADHGDLFEPQVMAEMRGVVDEHGFSPFWEAVGRHFFGLDFPDADYLSMADKTFIGELLPRHPIYVPLLPAAAQEVIGQVHTHTQPALALLRSEGFQVNGQVDIFEAGPVVSCPRDSINTIMRSRVLTVDGLVAPPADSPELLVANARFDFRCTWAPVRVAGDRCQLAPAVAEALAVAVGDRVRVAAPRAGEGIP